MPTTERGHGPTADTRHHPRRADDRFLGRVRGRISLLALPAVRERAGASGRSCERPLATGEASATRTGGDVAGTVSTRGDFRVVDEQVELTEGAEPQGFETVGGVPGFDGAAPDELVVFARGFRVTDWLATLNFETVSLALSTVADLDEREWETQPDSLTLLGAAVNRPVASMGGSYSGPIERQTAVTVNPHSVNENVLTGRYGENRDGAALGSVGSTGPLPDNYEDDSVNYVTTHFSYVVPGIGCFPEVIAEF